MTETLDFTTIFDLIIECGKCLIDCVELVTTVQMQRAPSKRSFVSQLEFKRASKRARFDNAMPSQAINELRLSGRLRLCWI